MIKELTEHSKEELIGLIEDLTKELVGRGRLKGELNEEAKVGQSMLEEIHEFEEVFLKMWATIRNAGAQDMFDQELKVRIVQLHEKTILLRRAIIAHFKDKKG
jgi:hypothetical protein